MSRTAAPGAERREEEQRRFPPLKEAAKKAVAETERALIEEALRYTLWNRRKAAKLFGHQLQFFVKTHRRL